MASDPCEVAATYDRVASRYEEWSWQRFWKQNERPLLEEIMSAEDKVQATLDVGTGAGAYVAINELHAQRLVGIDISLGMLRQLKREHPGALCVAATATAIPFKDRAFDRITANRVLSHVPQLGSFFEEAKRLLSPGGQLIISDLDSEHDYDSIRFSGLAGLRVPPLVPCRHSFQDLLEIAKYNGFAVQKEWRLRFCDLLWQPPAGQFTSLDRSNRRHVSYVVVLRRTR